MDDERGGDDIERPIAERHRHRVADLECVPCHVLAHILDLLRRGIDAGERGGRAIAEDRCAERAGAAADIEPARTFRCAEPGEELLADRAAPAPHEALVVVGGVEGELGFGHDLLSRDGSAFTEP